MPIIKQRTKLAFLVAVLGTLVGCGGGSAQISAPVAPTTPTPPTIPTPAVRAPTITPLAFAPANGTQGVMTSATTTAVYGYTDATTFTFFADITCAVQKLKTLVQITPDQVKKVVTVATTFVDAPSGSTCTMNVTGSATGDGGTTSAPAISFTFSIG